MYDIPVRKLNSQSFKLVLDNLIYRIRIYAVAENMMCADVSINSELVIQGTRCLHGEFVLPWPSLQRGGGNFMFYSDDEIVYFDRFGDTCFLTYYPSSEMVDTSNG